MINRNVMGRNPEDEEMYENDLTSPPEAQFMSDPESNSTAMLGTPSDESGEVSPEEAGPAVSLAYLGMMVQGAQGLASEFPGLVPMEITAWLQQAMQMLPQMIQQKQSALTSGVPGMGQPMMGSTAGLGPTAPPGGGMPPMGGPSGPPQRPY
jgi:hypothetical protein